MTLDAKPLSHRPRTGSETRKRQRRVAPRFTDEEYAEIDAKAEAAGLTVSSYARQELLSKVRTRSRRRPRADVAVLSRVCGELNRIGSNINQIARAANMDEPVIAAEVAAAMKELRDTLCRARTAMGFKP